MNPKKPRAPCRNCGTPTSRPSTIYCSNQCQKDFEHSVRREQVQATGDLRSGFQGVLASKRFLVKEDGHRCSICSRTEWEGKPIPLVMDHIDGNAENWMRDNLRLVCGNCDMQLPTYKSLNRGKGRAFRRRRYQEGKSY